VSELKLIRVQDDSTPRRWGPGNIQWWYSRFLCIGILAIGVFALWSYQHRYDALRTRRLELIGPDGAICAVMGAAPGGGTGLTLQDSKSQTRATIALTPLGNPRLTLQGEDGLPRAGMEVLPNGQSTLRLFNHEGAVRLALSVKPDGSSTVEVSDISGNHLTSFTLDGKPKPKEADTNEKTDQPDPQNRTNPHPAPAPHKKPLAITEGFSNSNVRGMGVIGRRVVE
jgi:hypothetical protein